jgi:hypothetical protein
MVDYRHNFGLFLRFSLDRIYRGEHCLASLVIGKHRFEQTWAKLFLAAITNDIGVHVKYSLIAD